MTDRPVASVASARARSLAVNFIACLVLLVQFLFGMVANLFVTIPAHHPGTNATDFFGGIATAITWAIPDGPVWLALHVGLGLALVIAALANLALAFRLGRRLYAAVATLGAAAIIGAAFNGFAFINYGHDASSMIMAGLWALSLFCYLVCGYLAARRS